MGHTAEGSRWFSLTLSEQLGNIGSEIYRAGQWSQRGDTIQREGALDRAFELFALTLSDPRWVGRLKELARSKEVVADWFYGEQQYGYTQIDLERYFDQFAYAARVGR